MKVAIHWVTSDWRLIRRIREKYRLPQMMNINYLTRAEVDEETLEALRKGGAGIFDNQKNRKMTWKEQPNSTH